MLEEKRERTDEGKGGAKGGEDEGRGEKRPYGGRSEGRAVTGDGRGQAEIKGWG